MSETPQQPLGSADPPTRLVSALRRLLRPLVRLALSRQVTYPFLAELLKRVFVETANRDFPIDGKRQTDSRISLLTGIHRKDVRRLRSEESEEPGIPSSVSLGAQIVARWTGVAEFLDDDGRPRPLPRLTTPGAGPSFETLVQSVSRDIRPRAVLDEWIRLGVARLDENDRVRLDAAVFIPSKGFDEKAFYFGRNLHDHIAAGAHNLLGGAPPFVDRSVYYDRLTRASVEELIALSEQTGMQAIQSVNRRAIELQQRDREGDTATLRMNFGIYVYHAETSEGSHREAPDES